jgi:hypothetical protein
MTRQLVSLLNQALLAEMGPGDRPTTRFPSQVRILLDWLLWVCDLVLAQ